ncbi:hypothetical protein ACIG0C_36035 [Kitasatospora aureofaciens]|uniref:Uncharacterized protein n=1 Tax=Kitasatospora aureofaciens TaxID=1894 RepID=A0A1E7NAR6_KITAU|nr:hypothetical protein [Kitasatospora aureofaciens]ARF78084.1 hypothetical protein B6264_03365 [Kitasatospora aureofaciens]OEV37781.1 hypothetical protein HS99_0024635 [Kitasatospora aureofaciens]
MDDTTKHFTLAKLLASSRRWMHEAMRHAAAEPPAQDLAVHHAQVAAEHLLKGFIADKHPALIAANATMLMHATGALRDRTEHAAQRPLEAGASITAREAFDTAREFTKLLDRVSNQRWTAAVSARNGVAHVGLADPTTAEEHMVTCFDIVDALLDSLGRSREEYWGTWISMRDTLGKAYLDEATRRLQARLARARARFQEQFGGQDPRFGEPVTVAMLPLLWSQQGLLGPGTSGRSAPCPAKGHSGMLLGHNLPQHYDDTERARVFVSHSYFCQICGLTAQIDEFEPLGLPLSLDIAEDGRVVSPPDRDPSHWHEVLHSAREAKNAVLDQEIADGVWCGFPGLDCACDRGWPTPPACERQSKMETNS